MSVRNYNMDDATMNERSHVVHQHFANHLAEFSAFDADFADPFAPDWDDAITAAEAVETDEQRDDQLRQETADVLAAMAEGRRIYGVMKYWIEKTFAAKPAVADKFGMNDYDVKSRTQKGMAQFLTLMHGQATITANHTLLNAAGCNDATIAEILAIKNTLIAENTGQEVYKDESPAATKARIDTGNDSFLFWQKVNRASKVIYAAKPEYLNLFLFPRNTETTSVFNVVGNVTAVADGTPIGDAAVTISYNSIATTTDADGNYGFAGIPDGDYNITVSKAGFQDSTLPVQIVGGTVTTQNFALVAA